MRREHLVDLAARRLDTCDQSFPFLVLAQLCGNGIKRTRQIVGDRQNVASKAGRGIGARVGDLLLHPAAQVLRVGLGVEHLLLRLVQLGVQLAQRFLDAVLRGILAFAIAVDHVLGNALQFVLGCFVAGRFVVAHGLFLFN